MGSPLIEIDDARHIVVGCAHALGEESVELERAVGRVLARDASAPHAVPPFNCSAMDGFAVRADDLAGAREQAPVVLSLIEEARAGHPASRPVAAGQAVAISTGAMIPDGADAVVRLEDTASNDGHVEISTPVQAGADIRHAGDDVRAGTVVIARGTIIGAAEAGVLASIGVAAPICFGRPCVAVLTTGDELAAPGDELAPGMVRNSNAYTVPALARDAGAQVLEVAHAPDDPDATTTALERALGADVAVVCGGVSVGAHDHVRASLERLGVEERFYGIALKPGKPTWFGTSAETLVFALPGNPVSAMVTFILLVRPALRALAGLPPEPRRSTATLTERYEKRPGRAHAVRCMLELAHDGWRASTTGAQDSHILTSMLGADALAIIPASSGPVAAGERVEIELLGGEPAGAAGPRAPMEHS